MSVTVGDMFEFETHLGDAFRNVLKRVGVYALLHGVNEDHSGDWVGVRFGLGGAGQVTDLNGDAWNVRYMACQVEIEISTQRTVPDVRLMESNHRKFYKVAAKIREILSSHLLIEKEIFGAGDFDLTVEVDGEVKPLYNIAGLLPGSVPPPGYDEVMRCDMMTLPFSFSFQVDADVLSVITS